MHMIDLVYHPDGDIHVELTWWSYFSSVYRLAWGLLSTGLVAAEVVRDVAVADGIPNKHNTFPKRFTMVLYLKHVFHRSLNRCDKTFLAKRFINVKNMFSCFNIQPFCQVV